MWLLSAITFLLSAAAQQGEARIATPNIELSMMGYDPLMTDAMERLDQAKKFRIFIAQMQDSYYYENTEPVLNYFVEEVEHSSCSPSFTEAVARTYEEYRSLTTASITFVTEADATTPLGATEFNFKVKAGYGNLNNANGVLIRDYFNQSEKEVRLVKVECITHSVSILPSYEAVFTYAFKAALDNLNKAAMSTNSETRHKLFSRFVRSYETHFARTTHFGYTAYFVKLFANQAKTTAEKDDRRLCMMVSARETLTPGARRGCETTGQHFSRIVTAKCGEVEVDELDIETGGASVSDAADCNLAAKESPRPVDYILKKISSLFEEKWISEQLLENRKVYLNSTALSVFFREQLGEYSQDIIEKAETPTRKHRPWRRFIKPNSTAVVTGLSKADDKTCSAVNGPIIIVGGLEAQGIPSTTHSTSLFGPALPPFPVPVYDNTVSSLGTKIYSCGGKSSRTNKYKKCWVIDTGSPNATWEAFNIEWELSHHSAVVVKEDIWFFLDSKLRILQTRNATNTFREFTLGFSFDSRKCAVAHGSRTFVIGVGEMDRDVYVNNDSSKPEQWDKFATLRQGRSYSGCLVFGGEVLVTAGRITDSLLRLSSVEAISLVDGTVRSFAPLGWARSSHHMAIIHDRPAVLGGWNGTTMATIETYDGPNNLWETLGYSLTHPRSWFGFTQYFP